MKSRAPKESLAASKSKTALHKALPALLAVGALFAVWRLYDYVRFAPAREAWQKGVASVEAGDLKTALQIWREGTEKYPDFAPNYVWLADSYLETRQYAPAKEILLRLQKIAPNEPHIACKLADASLGTGDPEAAERLAEQEGKTAEECARAHLVLAKIAVGQGEEKKTLDHLRSAFVRQPKDLETAELLAQVSIGLKEYGTARKALQGLLPDQEENAGVHYLLGLAFARDVNAPESAAQGEAHLLRAIQLNDKLEGAHYELGALALRQGDLKTARERLETAAKIAPDYSPAQEALLRLYIRLNLPELARKTQTKFADLKRKEMEQSMKNRRETALRRGAAAGELFVGVANPEQPKQAQGAFTDIAEAAGVQFVHTNGAWGRHYYVEVTGSGCAFLDYDRDGWLDVILLQAGRLPVKDSQPPKTLGSEGNRLFRNRGDGTFEDKTQGSGLERTGYAQGIAVGDYDGDGWEDLYITAYGGCALLHNERGSGKFRDVTKAAGVGDQDQGARLALSAAWGDYDRDGRLDLLVTHYVKWTFDTDIVCIGANRKSAYCHPDLYEPETQRLYHNDGGGRFSDVTKKAGLADIRGRGMGCVWLDYDKDGWIDLFIACDMTPNILLKNRHDGTFQNVALEAGVAFGENGELMSGMGVAAGDYDNNGFDDLLTTNYENQGAMLFKNEGRQTFSNMSSLSRIRAQTLAVLGFGCEFVDVDRDGWKDAILANGHVMDDIDLVSARSSYAQRKSLLRNLRDGRFEEVTENLGDLATKRVSRGLALGDFDNDGDLDVLINNQNASAQLLRNDYPAKGGWIALQLETPNGGVAYHAKATLYWAGRKQYAEIRAGSSYCSHSDTRLYFGLGETRKIDRIEIVWANGKSQTLTNPEAGRLLKIREAGSASSLKGR